jgi:quercetin dioxygenase-like cupin family protein
MTLRVQKWNELGRPLPETLRQQLKDEGYDVFEWSDAPGTVYGPHSHEDDQCHWIISGTLELTVGGESYTLWPGDRDFLAANTVHSAFVPGSQPVRYLIGSKRS